MSQDLTPEALRKAYAVPSGLALRSEGPAVLAWATGLAWAAGAEAAVRRVATDPSALTASGVGGRAPLGRLPAEGGAVLVRSYRKGGLLRAFRGSRFRGRMRPLDELVLHHELALTEVPVAEALGCVVHAGRGGWTGELLLREVVGAMDLEAWLHGAGTGSSDVLLRAGQAVRALHDQGIEHADLHPGNLLLTPNGAVLVIDLDKARRHGGALGEHECLGNLARFERAIEKHAARGMPRDRWESAAFYTGYAGSADGAARWHDGARARLGGLALRKLWWSLAGAARKGAHA